MYSSLACMSVRSPIARHPCEMEPRGQEDVMYVLVELRQLPLANASKSVKRALLSYARIVSGDLVRVLCVRIT